MKNTTLLILLSLFIISCGEKIREEITERYDNGKMKTIMKFIGEGSEEVMIEKLVYSQSGDTLVLENYNSKGEKDGKWIGYIDDSFVKRNYKDGELDGKWTFWYENGQKKEKRFYKLTDEGFFTNIGTIWYPNGREWKSTFYIGKERVTTLWYENGIMQSQFWSDIANNSAYSYEIHFNQDGKIHYEAIYWASLGDVMYRGYEDGKLIDKGWFGNCYENEFAYDLNGVYVGTGEEVKCPEELFRVWQGTWTIRHNNGNKKIERVYKDGDLLAKTCWDEYENECACGEYWWEGCK